MHYVRWSKYGDPMITRHREDTCGTKNGYARHKRRDEDPCEPCRESMNAYNRERRAKARAINMPATIGTCDGCNLPMVARKTPPTHVPYGHRKAQNETTCKRCYDKALRAQKATKQRVEVKPVDEVEEMRRTKASRTALDAYMRERAARIERNQRIAMARKYGRAA